MNRYLLAYKKKSPDKSGLFFLYISLFDIVVLLLLSGFFCCDKAIFVNEKNVEIKIKINTENKKYSKNKLIKREGKIYC